MTAADKTDQPESVVLRHMRPPLLDNLGITVNYEQSCPSWPLRSALSRVMFGHRRLGRFWCLWLRPWLMPRWQAQVEAAWERAGDLTRAELLSAILDQSGEKRGQPEEGDE